MIVLQALKCWVLGILQDQVSRARVEQCRLGERVQIWGLNRLGVTSNITAPPWIVLWSLTHEKWLADDTCDQKRYANALIKEVGENRNVMHPNQRN